eukprot:358687-Chlamydomonas_euryale.AAC.6
MAACCASTWLGVAVVKSIIIKIPRTCLQPARARPASPQPASPLARSCVGRPAAPEPGTQGKAELSTRVHTCPRLSTQYPRGCPRVSDTRSPAWVAACPISCRTPKPLRGAACPISRVSRRVLGSCGEGNRADHADVKTAVAKAAKAAEARAAAAEAAKATVPKAVKATVPDAAKAAAEEAVKVAAEEAAKAAAEEAAKAARQLKRQVATQWADESSKQTKAQACQEVPRPAGLRAAPKAKISQSNSPTSHGLLASWCCSCRWPRRQQARPVRFSLVRLDASHGKHIKASAASKAAVQSCPQRCPHVSMEMSIDCLWNVYRHFGHVYNDAGRGHVYRHAYAVDTCGPSALPCGAAPADGSAPQIRGVSPLTTSLSPDCSKDCIRDCTRGPMDGQPDPSRAAAAMSPGGDIAVPRPRRRRPRRPKEAGSRPAAG